MDKKQKQFGFVILHYMALEMTMQCIDNLIKKFGKHDISIVIVDNASPNGSGKELQNRYHDNKLVTVILNNKNEGFARGNNIGFDYLKNNYDIDYMIVMNNDVLIEQDDFLNKITDIYINNGFDVLGPDIFESESKKHQNPIEDTIPTIEKCRKDIQYSKTQLKKDTFNYYKLLILHYTIYIWAKPLIKAITPKLYQKFIAAKQQDCHNPTDTQDSIQTPRENVILNGACFIFSKRFIKNRNYAFYPGTFMYVEERILSLQCKKEGYKILYHPDIKIKHLSGVSTNKKHGGKHLIFMWEHLIKSMQVYIELYTEYERQSPKLY